MSCDKCGLCQVDVPTLENITVDMRLRGNYGYATLLDQALEKCGILRENLQANDREYLKNVSRMVKEHSTSRDCTNILRDAKHIVDTTKGRQQSTPHSGGFANMLAASRGVSSTPTPKQTEPELRSSSGFIQMLDANSKKTDEEPVRRALEEIEADEKKYRRQSSEPTRRGMGFKNMFEASQKGTFEGDEEFKPQPETRSLIQSGFQRRGAGFGAMLEAVRPAKTTETPHSEPQPRLGFLRMLDTTYQQHVENGSVETHARIPCGLAAMLEAMSPNRTRETLDEKPHVRRGMGFANMLRGAAEGTE